MLFFERLAVGDAELEPFAITPAEIMNVARAFDPQAYHVHPEAA